MRSEVENLGGLSRKITVTVPQEQVVTEFNKRINELAKKADIKGFRKGKVPASVIKLQFGEAIKQEVIRDILEETLPKALHENEMYLAGTPKVEITNIKDEAPLEYVANFEVLPQIENFDLKNIAIERLQSTVEEENVTQVIEKLRKQNAKLNEVERPAQLGDVVIIDFKGYIDDIAFKGGEAKAFQLELGSHQMIPGFEEALLKANKNDEIEFEVTFPEDYPSKEQAGKKARFLVNLIKVMAPELPELNEAFAKDLGVTTGTLDGLREEVQKNLTNELDRRVRAKVKEQIIDKLIEKNDIEIPQSLIEMEVKQLQHQLSEAGHKQPIPLQEDSIEALARKHVLVGLILSQYIKDKKITVDEDKVRNRIEEVAAGYHHPAAIINWYYSNEKALTQIQSGVLEDQAIDKMLEEIKIIDKPVSFDEIVK